MGLASAALVLLSLGQVARPPSLARAEREVDEVRLAEAARTLDALLESSSLDRASLLRALQLDGAVHGQLGHRSAAQSAFRQLLFLDASATLEDRWGPKIRLIFFEAKGWVSQHGALAFTRCPAKVERGQVRALCVDLGADPLHLQRTIRFHVLAAGDLETLAEQPATPGRHAQSVQTAAIGAMMNELFAPRIRARQELLEHIARGELTDSGNAAQVSIEIDTSMPRSPHTRLERPGAERRWRWLGLAGLGALVISGGALAWRHVPSAPRLTLQPPSTRAAPPPQPRAPESNPTLPPVSRPAAATAPPSSAPTPASPAVVASPRPVEATRERAPRPHKGRLSLQTSPWTEVFYKGRSLGVTPLANVSLPAGEVRLLLVNPERNIRQEISIDIRADRGLVKNLKL